MRLAATHGQAWVTTGRPAGTDEEFWAGVADLARDFAGVMAEADRPDEPWRYPPSLVAGALQTFAILFVLHWLWTVGVGNSWVTEDPESPDLRVSGAVA